MSEKKSAAAVNSKVVPTVETKAANKNKIENTTKKDGFCVYLGPTITNLIQSGTIYEGSKEKVLASIPEAIKRVPLIASLIVTDKTLSEDRIKVKTPGNILNVNYNKIVKGTR